MWITQSRVHAGLNRHYPATRTGSLPALRFGRPGASLPFPGGGCAALFCFPSLPISLSHSSPLGGLSMLGRSSSSTGN
jgi:hypothetical protein